MNHASLADSPICPHCGDRYKVEEQQNKAGDIIRRGLCPNAATAAAVAIEKYTATPWEMVRRAAMPASALTPGEVEAIRAGEAPAYLEGVELDEEA